MEKKWMVIDLELYNNNNLEKIKVTMYSIKQPMI